MNVRVFAVSILLVSAAGTAVPLACGDKFLLPSRGTRFERAPLNRQPANVLVYANPASPLPRTLSKLSVGTALRKVGYRPTIVDSPASLERALTAGGWDVIVVDLGDGASVRARVDTRSAAVVPVAEHIGSGQLAEARKQYPTVIKSPGRSQTFVDAVDDALASRQSGAKASSKSH